MQNIAGSLAQVAHEQIVARSIFHFRNADPEYGARVEAAVKQRRGSRREPCGDCVAA